MKKLNIALLLLNNVYGMEKSENINIKSSNRVSPDPELLAAAAIIISQGKCSPGSPVCSIISDPDFFNHFKAKKPAANNPK